MKNSSTLRRRCRGYLLICSLVVSAPTLPAQAADGGRAGSSEPPSQSEPQLEQMEARALAFWSDGRFAEAVETWSELIRAAPERRSYRIGLVRTLVSAGQVQQARAALDDAKRVAGSGRSDEYNLLVAEAEVLRAESRNAAAADAFAAAADIAGRDSSRRSGGFSSSARQHPWRLSTGAVFDRFDNRRGNEHQVSTQLGYRYSRDLLLFALYERHDRFDAVDAVYLAGAAMRLGEDFALHLNLGASPGADFRPRREGSMRLEWLASEQLRPLIGYQVLDYDQGNITTVTPGLRLRLASGINVELQYALTDELQGSTTRIGGVRIDWLAGERWLPSVNYYRGEEALPPQQRARFQRIGAGLIWLATPRWYLRTDVAYEDREQLYTAESIALSLGVNF